MNISQITKDILNLAPLVSEEIKKGFKSTKRQKLIEIKFEKNNQDITTLLDHKIGQIYIDKIYTKYSEIITVDSEEDSERIGSGPITLRLDPVDGTKHYFMGIPIIASSLALVENNETLFSMVIDVFAENLYFAYKNKGAYLNNSKINVNNLNINDDFSFVMYESSNSSSYQNELNTILNNSYRTRNIGLASLSICHVADGSSSAYVNLSKTTKLYDVEGGLLIAKEAGAICTDINYKNEGKKKISEKLIVANPTAFKEIAKLFSEFS